MTISMNGSASIPRSDGSVPLLDVEGTVESCGQQLGYVWREALQLQAARRGNAGAPWWQDARFKKLVDRHAPYLPTLFSAMADGAGLQAQQIDAPVLGRPATGCTSFAISPSATAHGEPISGQTKDTPIDRQFRFVVLRLKPQGAAETLTLTYPGEVLGQGFTRGGCSVFRNALNAGAGSGLPFFAWGILAQRCPSVEDVEAMTRDYGIDEGGHCTVADEHGGVLGVENGRAGVRFLRPERGLYIHANASLCMERCENDLGDYEIDSPIREVRMRELFERDLGRLTPQLAYAAMTDHANHPTSLCRHQGRHAMTTAAVVAEPTRGLLHVTRGNPCQNWPHTYRL